MDRVVTIDIQNGIEAFWQKDSQHPLTSI